MKITDKGLEQILSLGLMRPTKTPGIYYLYSWKSVDYYCGLALSKTNLKKDGLFISLTESQLKSLPLQVTKASDNPALLEISKYFQTCVHLEFDAEANCLNAKGFSGQNSKIIGLQIPLDTLKESSQAFQMAKSMVLTS